jgi:hypothetical protein
MMQIARSPNRQIARFMAVLLLAGFAAAGAAACSDPEKDRLRETTKPTYDPETGRLTQLTFDANKNGVIDTWTYMDGTRVLRSEIDTNEDGVIDRWEYHDGDPKVVTKVGFSRANDGRPDAWAIIGPDGQPTHVEVSLKRDDTIDRWEWYEGETLVRAEEDTTGDGKPDKWETYAGGAVATVAFDENGDGKPDRRLTYAGGALESIESAPDDAGVYAKKVAVAR